MNIPTSNYSDSIQLATRSAIERAEAIVELVRRSGFQRIENLSLHFNVTPQTIRRDVNSLCDLGILRRRHGGVDVPCTGENLAYPMRQVLNIDAKRAIARRVAKEVPEDASLFFGIGTTPEQCAHALQEHTRLRVMTNNINVAVALSPNPLCEITLAGGRIRNSDQDMVSSEAHNFFARFSVDIGIYGVAGVAEDGTLLDFSSDEVHMRTELSTHCRQRFLVLDHSKFGRSATVRGGHITDATAVFTDKPISIELENQLHQAGVRLIICSDPVLPRNFRRSGL
ncbi:DeoR/GlpR family DNA-binding transcription regulator [Undibacterium sp. SXout11W]|uniref:DeoR/GlpR family DNA-binding transcription regulator n=1 Tax=Undibacterium sp. SXout11W TaxID=3413050 RepID=UPI003BF02274